MTVSVKSKFVPERMMGDASAVKNSADGRMVMGIVLGDATRIVERTLPTGGKYAGFGGTFEGVQSNGDVIRSSVLYVPNEFFPQINDALQAAWKEDDNARVQFAFEVASVKADTPVGYGLQFTMLGEPSKGDPLAGLRAHYVPQAEASAQQAAPAKPAGGKRR